MRRILLIVAMLLIAVAPAMAAVTVNAKHIGLPIKAGVNCSVCEVNYVCTGGDKVRAFALEISVSNGYTITGIHDFNVGESNKVGNGVTVARPGYGIFPAKFRDVINPADVNWVRDSNYNPIAPATDADANGTGLGTNKIIVELGSLYVGDNNAPPATGSLFRFDILGTPGTLTNISIVANATRGGVVLEDGNTVAATLNGHTGAGFPECFPCYSTYATQYNDFLAVFKPNCWCGRYAVADPNGSRNFQCYGDTDAKTEGLQKYRVYSSDYTRLVAAWKKTVAQLRAMPNGLCADFDHQAEGLQKYRVYSSDYTKLVAGWKKTDAQLTALGLCPK